MPQMPVAFGTTDFNPDHSMRGITIFRNGIGRRRFGKAGPARSAVIFCVGTKQQCSAAAAQEISIPFFNVQRSAEGPLGTGLTQYMILHRGKARTPFVVAQFQLIHLPNVRTETPPVKSSRAIPLSREINQILRKSVKMYRNISCLFCIGLALAMAPVVSAQDFGSNPFARESDNKARPLHIEIRSSLDFSRATATGSNGGSIAIDPDSGTRTTIGDVLDLGGSPFAGSALVSGEPGRAVRIDMPPTIRLTSATGGSVEIVKLRTNLPPAARLDMYGRLEFAFGGDLLLKGNVSGQFRGRIPITAEYE